MKRSYSLTPEAKADLWAIYDWGVENFGEPQADWYFSELHRRFETISDSPEQFVSVDHYYPGLRRCTTEAHSIYFLVIENETLIVRILGWQDPFAAFENE